MSVIALKSVIDKLITMVFPSMLVLVELANVYAAEPSAFKSVIWGTLKVETFTESVKFKVTVLAFMSRDQLLKAAAGKVQLALPLELIQLVVFILFVAWESSTSVKTGVTVEPPALFTYHGEPVLELLKTTKPVVSLIPLKLSVAPEATVMVSPWVMV